MSNLDFKKALNFMGFFAIVFASVSLVIGKFVNGLEIFDTIGAVFAYICACVTGFYYARSKRGPVAMIIWIVCSIVVIVLLAMRIFKF